MRAGRRISEVLAEGLAEAALRVVARVERRGGEVLAFPQRLEPASQTLGTAVGVEAHTVGPLEVTARALGAHTHRAQLAEEIVGHPLPGSVKMGGNLQKLRAASRG